VLDFVHRKHEAPAIRRTGLAVAEDAITSGTASPVAASARR
jgi:hypothetical protein